MHDEPTCNGQFTRCSLRLDDRQLSEFIREELESGRVELVTHVGDKELGVMAEKNTWLVMEIVRRFGQRQSRGIETIFTIKRGMYKFAENTMPMPFGNFIIFPMESACVPAG